MWLLLGRDSRVGGEKVFLVPPKKRPWQFWIVVIWEFVWLSLGFWAFAHICFGFPMIAMYADYFDKQSMLENGVQIFGFLLHVVAFIQLLRRKANAAWFYVLATIYAIGVTIPQGIVSGYWTFIWSHNRVLIGLIETYYVFVPSLLVTGYVWYLRRGSMLESCDERC